MIPLTYQIRLKEYEACIVEAQKTFEKYENNAGAHYPNSLSSHLIGRLGEHAAAQFFKRLDPHNEVQETCLNPYLDQEADLVTAYGRVEVKTWMDNTWSKYGGSVAVSQFERLQTKADAIMWQSLRFTSSGAVVTFWGFNWMDDFEGIDATRTVSEVVSLDVYRMPEESMRSLIEFSMMMGV